MKIVVERQYATSIEDAAIVCTNGRLNFCAYDPDIDEVDFESFFTQNGFQSFVTGGLVIRFFGDDVTVYVGRKSLPEVTALRRRIACALVTDGEVR